MRELNQEELVQTRGGVSITSSSLINSFANAVKVLLDLGRSLGSSIRRIESDQICPIK